MGDAATTLIIGQPPGSVSTIAVVTSWTWSHVSASSLVTTAVPPEPDTRLPPPETTVGYPLTQACKSPDVNPTGDSSPPTSTPNPSSAESSTGALAHTITAKTATQRTSEDTVGGATRSPDPKDEEDAAHPGVTRAPTGWMARLGAVLFAVHVLSGHLL